MTAAYIFAAAWLITTALLVIACLGDVDLAERLRKANAERVKYAARSARHLRAARSLERRQEVWLDDLNFATVENARLTERVRELEARELPWLAEIRERGAL